MKKKSSLIKGTVTLTLTGIISRIIGFFYRIFLSNTIGAEGMGIYQLIFPVYILCLSLSVIGIQTAISKYTSAKLAANDRNGALNVLYIGMTLAVIPALLLTFLVFQNAQMIALYFLNEPRCEALLRILCFSIPFAAIHSCINGYYYGVKKASIPAISQLIEQIIRVSGVYLIYLIFLEKGITISATLAVIGSVLGEIASALYTITKLLSDHSHDHYKPAAPLSFSKKIMKLSLPLTANRVTVTLLQSWEAILIPTHLKSFGMTNSEALSVYGVLTGMSLPLLLFPSALTNSLSVMLLPNISEAQATKDYTQIKETAAGTIKYCLILGILCTGIFLTFGKRMGLLLFQNVLAGSFLVTLAWICPFLYLTTTLSSILHGLGKTFITFIHNLIGLSIRILFILFCVPKVGIAGYLWGILVSQLLITLLSFYRLNQIVPIKISLQSWCIIPIVSIGAAIGISIYSYILLCHVLPIPELLLVGFSCIILCFIYLLLLYVWGVLPNFTTSFLKKSKNSV